MRIAMMAATLTVTTALAAPAMAQQIKFMTGPQGGSWYPMGGAFQSMMAEDGIRTQVMPGAGIANVVAIQTGKADLAFANSITTVDAINGNDPFETASDNICNVATLYPQYFQMVASKKSGITKVEDWRGKRISTQPYGNTAEQITRELLKVVGMTYDDLRSMDYVSYSDGVALMQDNNIDVFTLGTHIPASSIMDLANSTAIHVISLEPEIIERMRTEINPGYIGITIPAGTYDGQTEDALVPGYTTHIIARCDLDEKIVTSFLTHMWDGRDDLTAIAAIMGTMSLEGMVADLGVPLHPAATSFYQGHGVLD